MKNGPGSEPRCGNRKAHSSEGIERFEQAEQRGVACGRCSASLKNMRASAKRPVREPSVPKEKQLEPYVRPAREMSVAEITAELANKKLSKFRREVLGMVLGAKLMRGEDSAELQDLHQRYLAARSKRILFENSAHRGGSDPSKVLEIREKANTYRAEELRLLKEYNAKLP